MRPSPILIAIVVQWLLAAFLLTLHLPALGPLGGVNLAAGCGLIAGLVLYCVLAWEIVPLASVRVASRPLLFKCGFLAVTALAEEIIWRGFAFTSLSRHEGAIAALVMTTIGFAVMHMYNQGWNGVATHLMTGLAFGLAVVLSGQLLPAVLMHVGYSIAVVLASGARVRLASA
jgi:membrane protease YdiL (CAAX protease family)